MSSGGSARSETCEHHSLSALQHAKAPKKEQERSEVVAGPRKCVSWELDEQRKLIADAWAKNKGWLTAGHKKQIDYRLEL